MGELLISFYPDTKSIADFVGEKYFFFRKKLSVFMIDIYIFGVQ